MRVGQLFEGFKTDHPPMQPFFNVGLLRSRGLSKGPAANCFFPTTQVLKIFDMKLLMELSVTIDNKPRVADEDEFNKGRPRQVRD